MYRCDTDFGCTMLGVPCCLPIGTFDIVLMDGHAEAQEVSVGAKLAFIGLTMARAGYAAYGSNCMLLAM